MYGQTFIKYAGLIESIQINTIDVGLYNDGTDGEYEYRLSAGCQNTDNGVSDSQSNGCDSYVYEDCGNYDDDDFSSSTMCCACKEIMPNGK